MRKFNKKGASVDNFYAIVTFFGLVIFFLAVMLFWNGVKDELFWDESSVGSTIKDNAQNAVNVFDFILVLVYFGIHLGILVMAFLLRTHPVVYVAAIILIAILALVAAPLSNAYEDMQDNEDIALVVGDIPITNFIMSKLPMFEIIWGIITAICLFGFAKWGDSYG